MGKMREIQRSVLKENGQLVQNGQLVHRVHKGDKAAKKSGRA